MSGITLSLGLYADEHVLAVSLGAPLNAGPGAGLAKIRKINFMVPEQKWKSSLMD